MPKRFIIFDMEWTAWEGSRERAWSGPGEQREIYDIGAILVDSVSLEVQDTFQRYVMLELTAELPEYSVDLTGITQKDIDREGVSFAQALASFHLFCQNLPIYCWGTDGVVLAENCDLKKLANPFPPTQFSDIRQIFKQRGIAAENYYSSTIGEAFGLKNTQRVHQGVNDALSILAALKALKTSI